MPLTPSNARQIRFPSWSAPLALMLLVIGSSITSLRNGWVQDDLPIIKVNPLVHTLMHPWALFIQAYWPWPYPRELYRPLTSTLFSLEWVIGGGHPVVFRIVSILLYLAATLAVYRLAKRLVEPAVAWMIAAFFAVDPLHVEAVAVAVNQAELVVGALMALLMTSYIDHRREGRPLTGRWIAMMGAGYFVAALFKEHALMLPAFMVAAELTVIHDPRPWRERMAALRLPFLVLMLTGVVFIAVRNAALHGNTKGSFTAEALSGLTVGQRGLTMLGVVRQWARLFLWPSHLQADYSPQEIVGATAWGWAQTFGAAIALATCWIAWACRRTRPQVTFGILWMMIALFPVSNVLIPTGIVLAERTLFLASIGALIAATDFLWIVGERIYRFSSTGRIAVVATTIVILAMGMSRSASRQTVWRDLPTLWFQTVIDAPLSYRAHHAYGSVLFDVKMERTAELEYRRALELFPKAIPVYLDLADKYRVAGKCEPAVKYYHQILSLTPNDPSARASEVACLLYMGDYVKAAAEARMGVSFGVQPKSLALYAEIADSAARVHAPPHTVNLPPPVDSVAKR